MRPVPATFHRESSEMHMRLVVRPCLEWSIIDSWRRTKIGKKGVKRVREEKACLLLPRTQTETEDSPSRELLMAWQACCPSTSTFPLCFSWKLILVQPGRKSQYSLGVLNIFLHVGGGPGPCWSPAASARGDGQRRAATITPARG